MMKNKLLLLSMGLTLLAQTIMAQVPSYVPTQGLVGYWPFSGNANDISGNGNNGIVNGATLTTDRNGNANSAYYFNGSSEISVPHNNSFNTQEFTIAFWANFNYNDSSVPGLIGKGSNITNNFIIYINDVGRVHIICQPPVQQGVFTNSVNYNNGQWNNFVFTLQAGGSAKVYVNGTLDNTSTISSQYLTDNSLPLKFGDIDDNFFPSYIGKLDDIGIWNRALTQQEITAMYSGVTYSDTCNNVSGSLTQGLVGYWPFCGNANDDSGNGNNGTVNGAMLTTDRFGNANSAYSFDGNDWIEIQQSNTLNLPKGTISLWFKNNINSLQTILAKNVFGTAENENYGISIFDNSSIGFYCKYNSNCQPSVGWNLVSTPNNYLDNNFHNLICVIDDNIIKIYIDGILKNTLNTPNANADVCPNSPLFLGRDYALNQLYNYKGVLDDIGIWNRALTPSEITQLYNQNQCFTNTTVTDTLVINVGQLSYTNPLTYANNITIAPNPASTEVNINFNNITDLVGGSINIINSLGQSVATTPITATGTQNTMQLATWGGTGMYFVQIINPQGIVVDVKKIILQ